MTSWTCYGAFNCHIIIIMGTMVIQALYGPWDGPLQVNITTFEVVYARSLSSSEWQMVHTKNERNSVLYSCCPNPFVDVEFKFVLRRRPTFASHLFVAPSVILCLITPSSFILPPASLEKLTLGKFQRCFSDSSTQQSQLNSSLFKTR